MPFLFLLMFFSTISHASIQNITSFHSEFEQTIVDDNKKTIRYRGELWASKPQNALWVYRKPIQKSVYIHGKQLTILEPQIEQVTYRTLGDEIDFLEIIKRAKEINSTRYSATLKGQTYSIFLTENILSSISYEDEYENKITIKFINPKQNQPIDFSRFKPIVPKGYDVIE